MRRAFTLIEMLFVLGILAITLAVAIPSVRGMQEESRLARVQTDLLMLQSAAEAYLSAYGELPPVENYQTEIINKTGILTGQIIDPLTRAEYIFRKSNRYYIFLSPGLNRQEDTEFDLTKGVFSNKQDDLLATNMKERN